MEERYQPAEIETRVQRYWEDNQSFVAVEDPSREKILLLVDVPLPQWPLAYGACT